jgi:hypothetical protein
VGRGHACVWRKDEEEVIPNIYTVISIGGTLCDGGTVPRHSWALPNTHFSSKPILLHVKVGDRMLSSGGAWGIEKAEERDLGRCLQV